ncbi:TniQ family protein [Paraburkholderia terrae]
MTRPDYAAMAQQLNLTPEPIVDAIDDLNEWVCLHVKFATLQQTIMNAVRGRSRDLLIVVIGPARVGKTTLFESIAGMTDALARQRGKRRGCFRFSVPPPDSRGRFNWIAAIAEAYAKSDEILPSNKIGYGDITEGAPRRNSISGGSAAVEEALWESFIKNIHLEGLFTIVDEGNTIPATLSDLQVKRAIHAFKYIVAQTKQPLLIGGTSAVRHIVEHDPQLKVRTKVLRQNPYDDNEEDEEQFRSFIVQMEERLGPKVCKPCSLSSHSKEIRSGVNGRCGLVVRVATDALSQHGGEHLLNWPLYKKYLDQLVESAPTDLAMERHVTDKSIVAAAEAATTEKSPKSEKLEKKAALEQQKIPMRPIIPSRKYDLVEPIGIGTGLVEASSSLWKRAAERSSVSFADFVRWAFDDPKMLSDSRRNVTGQCAMRIRFQGIDGATATAEMHLNPLRSLVASDRIEACTLLPFAGLFSQWHLLRTYRAWCPLCLASMLSGPGVYEPLLWRLRAVTMCPVHGVDLVTVCHVCMAPQQNVVGRFARVGCCNRCGTWMGTDEAAGGIRRAGESEAGVSRAIMILLSRTAKFENHDHDARSTLQKLLMVRGVRNFLISTCDISPALASVYLHVPRLPRLAVLATVASFSQQPLHRVILGQLVTWNDLSRPCIDTSKGRVKRDWTVLEREFRLLANGHVLFSLKDACEKLNISAFLARTHFPVLVEKLARRKKMLISKRSAEREREMLIRVRKAFRALIESGEYPSYPKLQDGSGVSMRDISQRFKDLMG